MALAMISIAFVASVASAHAIVGVRARLGRPLPAIAGSAAVRMSVARDSFSLVVLGDLHLEDDMTAHEQAREDCLAALRELSLLDVEKVKRLRQQPAGELDVAELELLLDAAREGELLDAQLVSLGDLGRKDIRHEPGDAGTTKCFADAKAFFDGFGSLPLNIVTGNHDLEGLDEFDTDASNLQAWLNCFGLEVPYWSRQVARRTLLVGLSTTRFRESPFSSHEVHISDEQIAWFERTLESHPAADGWRVLVFSHAPPLGCGLRVLQGVHIRNGCAWLNHCGTPAQSRAFLKLVRAHPQLKLWCSGHFHLSHDFEDSLTQVDGCTFAQVGVVGPKSTRDSRRQTRLVQGDSNGLRMYTVNHHLRDPLTNKALTRLDAEVDFADGRLRMAHGSDDYDHADWFSAYTPQDADGCYLAAPSGQVACTESSPESICWWHMADGKTLGVHDGQLVEYDAETLSPLGIVVQKDRLHGRQVVVVNEGKAVILVDERAGEEPIIEVVHPNDDGSYWRRLQRNKRVRQAEKAREKLAREWLEQQPRYRARDSASNSA